MSYSKAPIRVLSSSLALVAEVDDYEQAYITRSLTGYGQFEIVVNYNSPYASAFQKDYFVVFGNNLRRVGIIEDVTRAVGAGGKGSQKVTIIGSQAKSLLNRRLVLPATGANYYVQSDVQESAIKSAVYDQIGAGASVKRRLPSFSIVADQSRGVSVSVQVFNELLGDIITQIGEASYPYIGTDLYLSDDASSLVFDVLVGKDRTSAQSANRRICFSSEYDTIKEGSVSEKTADYRNVIYVGGQGDGASKTIVTVADTIEAEGVARKEEYLDAATLQTSAQLTTAGTSRLNALKQAIFSVDAQVLIRSQYVYGVDYDLGDLVEIKEYATLFTSQITEITESWGHADYSIAVGFGKPATTIGGAIATIENSSDQTNTNKRALGWKDYVVTYDLSSADKTQTSDEILADVIEITGSITANRTITLQTPAATTYIGRKRYTVSLNPKAGGTTARTLTLTTGVSGKNTVIVPLIPSSDTLLSGILTFVIYVDADGNVSAEAFQIDGSNPNGSYIKFGDGTLICYKSRTPYTVAPNALGAVFSGLVNGNIPFPCSFVGDYPVIHASAYSDTSNSCCAEVVNSSLSVFTQYFIWYTNVSVTFTLSWMAIGRWKA